MEDNPFTTLLSIMREQGKNQFPTLFRFGTVISPSPLKIDVSNTVQTADDLLKNDAIGELHSGDDVLLVTLDGDQTFIILCKVVGV